MMKIHERREKVLKILRRRNRYQFGQPPRTCNRAGAAACTDTSIQMIVLMAKDKKVSINDVRRRSGAAYGAPMTPLQAIRALRSYGLDYEIRRDLGALGVLRTARNKGPVILCERYWAHPQWKGYNYAGRTLNGYSRADSGNTVRPGFAKPTSKAGLTQWTFRGGHAVLVATDMMLDGRRVGIVRDPNHNSPARPERPAYDIVSQAQLRSMLNSWPGAPLVLAPKDVVIKR